MRSVRLATILEEWRETKALHGAMLDAAVTVGDVLELGVAIGREMAVEEEEEDRARVRRGCGGCRVGRGDCRERDGEVELPSPDEVRAVLDRLRLEWAERAAVAMGGGGGCGGGGGVPIQEPEL